MRACLILFAGLLMQTGTLYADDKKPLDESAIDALVQKALKDFEAPGVAVVIVKDDKVIYLKGHGVRDIDSKSPVTPDTQFTIASCTKAFAATSVGCMVADGKMKWDDPVRKHLPGYRMSDALADRDVTLRDLLSHRTGVIRHDILWITHDWTEHGWKRDEMIRRSGYLKADKPFRSVWGYNNLQYLAAGEAAAKVAGMSWEQLVQTRIFDPLGMKSSNFSVKDMVKAKDYAKPHARKNIEDGDIRVIEPFNIDNMTPAGGINSCVRDLSAWLRFQLNEGMFDGKRVLKGEVIRETHAPVIAVPATSVSAKLQAGVTVQRNYGLGWAVYDYRGKRVVEHGGSLFGYRSQATLLPSEKAGIAILTNLNSTPLPSALSNTLLDHLLGKSDIEWNKRHLEADDIRKAEEKKSEADVVKKRKPITKPALTLSGYTGTFADAAHGRIEIKLEGDALRMNWGIHKDMPVMHWHFDTFRLKDFPGLYRSAWGDRLLVFHFSGAGEVDSFRYLGHEFKKVKK